MAVYRFQVAMPQTSLLARDELVNTFHMEHVGSPLTETNHNDMCKDIVDLWQAKYGNVTCKTTAKVYAMGPAPHFPLGQYTKGVNEWPCSAPREIAICLSYARNKALPRERGRMYLSPSAVSTPTFGTFRERPASEVTGWALSWYSTANASLPDLGGIDWKFGVWSPTNQAFYQTTEAWVDNEWDTVRSRGLRPTARVSSVREG